MYIFIALVGLHATASFHDYRFHTIPNVLVGSGIVAAFISSFMFAGGTSALAQSMLGCVVGLAVFLPLYAIGKMGAGDVKLLAMSGAWLEPYGALMAGLYSVIFGGGLALVWLVHHNGVAGTFDLLLNRFYSLNITLKRQPAGVDGSMQTSNVKRASGNSGSSKMPYAFAIGLGSLLSYFIALPEVTS